MIPKIIHYCWFGNKPLPRGARKCIKTWEKYCPGYEIVQWNEDNFDVNSHPFCRDAYQAGAWAFVSDYARLKIIFSYGGIYLDADVELLKNLDPLLCHDCYFGIQQVVHLCNTGLGFGAVRENWIVEKMLEEYDGVTFDKALVEDLACPNLNHRVLEKLGYTFDNSIQRVGLATIYPPMYFDPLAPSGESEDLLSDETYSIHHYSNSWGSFDKRIKRELIQLIGAQRVAKFKQAMLH